MLNGSPWRKLPPGFNATPVTQLSQN
jgi:hypothetical protein